MEPADDAQEEALSPYFRFVPHIGVGEYTTGAGMESVGELGVLPKVPPQSYVGRNEDVIMIA